jgi:hypothetical protein
MDKLLGSTRTVAEHLPIIGSFARRAPDRPMSVVRQERVQRAANLMSDRQFHEAIRLHAAGKIDEAKRLLSGNLNYEGWARTLTEAERTKLEQLGLVYLFSQETE